MGPFVLGLRTQAQEPEWIQISAFPHIRCTWTGCTPPEPLSSLVLCRGLRWEACWDLCTARTASSSRPSAWSGLKQLLPSFNNRAHLLSPMHSAVTVSSLSGQLRDTLPNRHSINTPLSVPDRKHARLHSSRLPPSHLPPRAVFRRYVPPKLCTGMFTPTSTLKFNMVPKQGTHIFYSL